MNLSPDDPKLSEYALGEMDENSSAEFEAAMAEKPEVFDEVHEIRATASLVGKAVESAPKLELTTAQRKRILRLASAPAPSAAIPRKIEFVRPTFWGWFGKFVAGTAAAAVVVGGFIYSYNSGYRNGVVENRNEPAETENVSPDPSENHPGYPDLDPNLALPVGEGREDTYVATMSKVKPGAGNQSAEPGTDDGPGENPNDPENSNGPGLPLSPGTSESPDFVPVFENPYVEVSSSPRSSFPLRAARESYLSSIEKIVNGEQFPDPSSVRVEEFVNAFSYSVPDQMRNLSDHPFAVGIEVASCPWKPGHRLVKVTLAARDRTRGGAPAVVAEEIELLVEFNRERAARYRLLGFKGAGFVSAVSGGTSKARTLFSGDKVTALYEIVPAKDAPPSDSFRYATPNTGVPSQSKGDELLFLSASYKLPGDPDAESGISGSDTLFAGVTDNEISWKQSSSDFQLAAAAAAFGMKLAGSEHLRNFSYGKIEELAARSIEVKSDPPRNEFLGVIQVAGDLAGKKR